MLEHQHDPALVLHAHLHGYGAAVALSGAFTLEQAKTQAATGTATGIVHRPDAGPCEARARIPGRVRLLAIDRMTLEAHLENLIDRPIRGPIRFGPTVDLTGPGRSWRRLLDTSPTGSASPTAWSGSRWSPSRCPRHCSPAC